MARHWLEQYRFQNTVAGKGFLQIGQVFITVIIAYVRENVNLFVARSHTPLGSFDKALHLLPINPGTALLLGQAAEDVTQPFEDARRHAFVDHLAYVGRHRKMLWRYYS